LSLAIGQGEFQASIDLSGASVWMIEHKGTMKWHPPAHHPLDACYYSVVDETQLSLLMFGFTLVTNSVGNRFHIYR
jgi:hypothetical protein